MNFVILTKKLIVMNYLPVKKIEGSDCFSSKLPRYLREKLTLLKIFLREKKWRYPVPAGFIQLVQ